ncbi:MAG: GatB/YqeY domain-containing protein [Prevotellaceae bacterium]|nr:GatB/YqeY domain-containing protein [Prevotellaceae bacterium]
MLFDQISKDIVSAMKAKDKVRLAALRNVKKLFIEARTAPGAGDELSDEAALRILAKLAKQGKDTAALYREQNRPDLAEEEEAQVAVVESYLPRQFAPAELEAELRALIAELGAAGPQDMGRVMGAATKRLSGRAEGRAISAEVKRLLAEGV